MGRTAARWAVAGLVSLGLACGGGARSPAPSPSGPGEAPTIKGADELRVEIIGWSPDGRVALRLWHERSPDYLAAHPGLPSGCEGYLDAAGEPFDGGLSLLVDRGLHAIQSPARCTPPEEARAALAEAKAEMERGEIGRQGGALLPAPPDGVVPATHPTLGRRPLRIVARSPQEPSQEASLAVLDGDLSVVVVSRDSLCLRGSTGEVDCPEGSEPAPYGYALLADGSVLVVVGFGAGEDLTVRGVVVRPGALGWGDDGRNLLEGKDPKAQQEIVGVSWSEDERTLAVQLERLGYEARACGEGAEAWSVLYRDGAFLAAQPHTMGRVPCPEGQDRRRAAVASRLAGFGLEEGKFEPVEATERWPFVQSRPDGLVIALPGNEPFPASVQRSAYDYDPEATSGDPTRIWSLTHIATSPSGRRVALVGQFAYLIANDTFTRGWLAAVLRREGTGWVVELEGERPGPGRR